METHIYSSNVIKDQSVNEHIKYNLKWLNLADNRKEYPKVKVWLSKSSGYLNRGVPEFITKILVKYKGDEIFVEAKASKLASSINNANRKIRSMIYNSKKGGSFEKNK